MLECHLTAAIVKAGVARTASDWGVAEKPARMRMSLTPTTTPAKTKTKRRHTHAELAAAEPRGILQRHNPSWQPVLQTKPEMRAKPHGARTIISKKTVDQNGKQ